MHYFIKCLIFNRINNRKQINGTIIISFSNSDLNYTNY